MIRYVSIRDFAIIENIEIEFSSGLSVITGETGSGKSIVITAISLALGSRADSSLVRHGKDKAVIELAGDIEGSELVVTREINAAGKSLCRLNGRLCSLGELTSACRGLADIHGQYDNQSLLDPVSHLTVLDHFGEQAITPEKAAYQEAYQSYMRASSSWRLLLEKSKENLRKLDFFRYVQQEIDAASLAPGEEQDLKDRLSILKNRERIFEEANKAYTMLEGEGGSAVSLGGALAPLQALASYSEGLASLASEAEDMYYRLEEIGSSLRDTLESLTFSPTEIDQAMERLELIDSLKKKYDPASLSVEGVLRYRDTIAEELLHIENYDAEKKEAEEKERQAHALLVERANRLTAARKAAASDLTGRIQVELLRLDFPDAEVSVQVSSLEKPGPDGQDQVVFLIATNRGEPLKPLHKTASGGEISRIMLAIKKITAACDRIPTLIFDEIDQGISGRTAAVVGRELREIAKTSQVIVITHLPQIAAAADAAYRIYKESDQEATYTHIKRLSDQEQVEELARLLGGDVISEAARQNAKALLASSKREG